MSDSFALSLFDDFDFDSNPVQEVVSNDAEVQALDLFRDDDLPDGSGASSAPSQAATADQSSMSAPALESFEAPQVRVKRGRGRPKKKPDQSPTALVPRAEKQTTLIKNRKRRWSDPSRAEAVPQENPEVQAEVAKLRQLTTAFFTSDKLRSSSAHIADEFGLSRYFIVRTQQRLAAGAVQSQDSVSDAAMSKLLAACCNSQESQSVPSIRPQLHMRVRQYDETPIQLKIASAGLGTDSQNQTQLELEDAVPAPESAELRPPKRRRSGVASSEVQNCKLFLTEQRWHSLFLAEAEHGDKLHEFVVEGLIQTPLQVLASNKAGIMATALSQSSQKPWDDKIRGPSGFKRLLNIATTDDFSANHLAERMLQAKEKMEHPDVDIGLLHVTCDVHKVHGIAKSLFALNDLDFFVSGLIKAALTLRGGLLRDFKSLFRKYLVDHLEICRGQADGFGQDPAAHRNFMLNLFFSDVSESKRAQLMSLFNGDWQSPDLIHYCNGCCNSREHTLEKMMDLIPCFLRSGPKVFPRHKWLGADVCIDWFAKFVVCHQMLRPMINTLLNRQVREDQNIIDDLALAQSSQTVDQGQGAGDSSGTNADDFKLIYKQWRRVTLEWSQKDDLYVLMVFCRLTVNPQGNLMAKHLKISSFNWDQEQHLEELTSGQRQYRLLWCFQNEAAKECVSDQLRFLDFDFATVFPVESLTVQKSHFLFRMLVRSGVATHHYLVLRHTRYPYRLFGLLDAAHVTRVSIATKLLEDVAERPCILDTFTAWFVRQHCDGPNGSRTIECLLAPEPIAELRAIAKACSIDIASTECQHASNRRLILGKSVQTHRIPFEEASAHFVARGLRATAVSGFTNQKDSGHGASASRRGPLPKKRRRSGHYQKYFEKHGGNASLKRGGGGWTVFLSERRCPLPTTPAGKAQRRLLSQEYRALPPEELQRLKDKAFAAAQARKHGAKKLVSRDTKKKKLATKRASLPISGAAGWVTGNRLHWHFQHIVIIRYHYHYITILSYHFLNN